MARSNSASPSWMTPSATTVWAQALRTFFLIWGTAWLRRASAASMCDRSHWSGGNHGISERAARLKDSAPCPNAAYALVAFS